MTANSKCCISCLYFRETTGECGKPLPSDPFKVFKPKRPDYHVCSMYKDIPPMPKFGVTISDFPEERYCCDQNSPTIEELDIWIRNAEKQIEFWKKFKREKEEKK